VCLGSATAGGTYLRILVRTIAPDMPLAFALEAFSFLVQFVHFVVGEGSPGMGMSRGKIHGIGVFDKSLLPLLTSWFFAFSTFVEKSLDLQELSVVPDGCIFVVCDRD
jgi:hypothetical protein